jgi:WD40 repeat protein
MADTKIPETWTDEGLEAAPLDAERPDGEGRRFRVGRILGRGGCGEVRSAWDTGLRREIAVKLLIQQDGWAEARFMSEAQVTAQLEHPNIVPVHDFGRLSNGVPYLSMKRIRGRSLFEVVEAGELSLDQRLDVFRKVCDAVAFAHSKRILHRDLKTSNVMVGRFGEVQLMDWGLARPVDAAVDASTVSSGEVMLDRFESRSFVTHEGAVAGTPAYMSPEQASGQVAELSFASDIYSLGAILYELLTGRPPLEGDPWEIIERVKRGDLPRPSAVAKGVDRELEAVVLMAMALDPALRHPSVQALREDIDAWLEQRPLVHARSSALERLSKWSLRHRGAVQVGVGVGAIAATALSVGLWRYGVDVGAARDDAVTESQRARVAELATRDALVQSRVALADALWSQGRVQESWAALLQAAEEAPADPRPLGLALSQQTAWSPPPVSRCAPHGGEAVLALALAEGGHRALSWGGDGRVVVWDLASCAELQAVAVAGAPGPGAVQLDATHTRAAVMAGGRLHLLDLDRDLRAAVAVTPEPHELRLDGDAGWLAWDDGRGRSFDPVSAALGPIEGVEGQGWWRPDAGGRLRLGLSGPVGGEEGGVWERDGGEALWTAYGINAADLDRTGHQLLWASAEELGLVELPSGRSRWSVEHGPVLTVGLDPSEAVAWAVGFDGSVEVLDVLDDGAPLASFAWRAMGGVPFSPSEGAVAVVDGTRGARLVAVGGRRGVVSSFLRSAISARHPLAGGAVATGIVQGLAVHPGGRIVALGAEDGRLVLFDLTTLRVLRQWQVNETGLRQLAFSPDGRRLAVAARHDGVAVFDLAEGREVSRIPLPVRSVSVAWTPAGSIAVGDADGGVHRIDPDTGELHSHGPVVAAGLWDVTPLGQGRVLVGAHIADELGFRVVDLATGEVTGARPSDAAVYHSDVTPDGRWVASGRHDGALALWSPSDGTEHRWKCDDGPTLGVAFSPDGSMLATTGFSRRVQIWDVQTRTLLRSVPQHTGPGLAVAWTPDGGALLSVGTDGLAVLPIDAHTRHASAVAALEGAAGTRAAAFAQLGWWERVEPELDASGAEDPILRASARLAGGQDQGAELLGLLVAAYEP